MERFLRHASFMLNSRNLEVLIAMSMVKSVMAISGVDGCFDSKLVYTCKFWYMNQQLLQ
jgi:hypothetical protein